MKIDYNDYFDVMQEKIASAIDSAENLLLAMKEDTEQCRAARREDIKYQKKLIKRLCHFQEIYGWLQDDDCTCDGCKNERAEIEDMDSPEGDG